MGVRMFNETTRGFEACQLTSRPGLCYREYCYCIRNFAYQAEAVQIRSYSCQQCDSKLTPAEKAGATVFVSDRPQGEERSPMM
jgi:hypothetical protein